MKRAVLEAEDPAASHLVAASDLDEVAVRPGLVLNGAEHWKRPHHALLVAHGNRRGLGGGGEEERDRETEAVRLPTGLPLL